MTAAIKAKKIKRFLERGRVTASGDSFETVDQASKECFAPLFTTIARKTKDSGHCYLKMLGKNFVTMKKSERAETKIAVSQAAML